MEVYGAIWRYTGVYGGIRGYEGIRYATRYTGLYVVTRVLMVPRDMRTRE